MRYNEIMNIVQRADEFAERAHAAVNQTRKYTGEPYINHPREVRAIMKKYASGPISQAQEAAALLHDTIEDTNVTHQELLDTFGNEIATLVGWLTDVSKPTDGNRSVRKNLDLQHTAAAPPAAKTVKLSDLISNSISIVQHDPGFAVRYLKEKAALMQVLKEGDPGLYAEAERILKVGMDKLQIKL
jgi:(p)ppGpp synthase/HD superfamily hydrolase